MLANPHPTGTAGAYRFGRRLQRLLRARAPRCEWPGCGARAVRCDLDHDLAWPDGPTCACNGGPACRRHHRVKQNGWTKLRRPGNHVLWISPAGRVWSSPSQHQPPAAQVRAIPPLPAPDPLDELSPRHADEERWLIDPGNPLWDDPPAHELRADDLEPDDTDPADGHDTTWTWDLDDVWQWTAAEELTSR